MRLLLAAVLCLTFEANAQQLSPAITSWILNTTHATGYNGLETNVQTVQYSEDNVYVSCTCIPGYDIGPWAGNPNQPANQNFCFKLTLEPKPNMGKKTVTPLGHIGVWRNGVSVFNAKDARSYQNRGIWNQNAIVVEGASFDECLGHPAPNGEYHHHLNPVCLYDQTNTSDHSPIIGYAFDGYPIYGAYGYKNSDGSGGIGRMRSGYRLRSITDRTTRPDGSPLQASEYGPAIVAQYPLGYYIEDYEFLAGLGDLDEHNGRYCVTPEYPQGTYAYFVTIDEQGEAAYPYTLGPTYYGVVPAGNTGPQSGHNTLQEPVTTYSGLASIERSEQPFVDLLVTPNPASDLINVVSGTAASELRIRDVRGNLVLTILPSESNTYSINALVPGVYMIEVVTEGRVQAREKLIKQ